MLINGTHIAHEIQEDLRKQIHTLKKRKPGLAFILAGSNPASATYVKMKKKRCHEVGIFSKDIDLPENVTKEELLSHIHALNQDPRIDGILVQTPLPKHIHPFHIFEAIDPHKDVDGFHPINMGKLLLGDPTGFAPCTPLGILTLLDKSGIRVPGMHVVIAGRSNIVGKPLAAMLMQKRAECNATVTLVHTQTKHLKAICQTADILVAAMGQPHAIKKEMVQSGAVVIDVGINRIQDKKSSCLIGDVDFEEVKKVASHITPVPGGVGPMTIAMLLSNTFLSYQRRQQ